MRIDRTKNELHIHLSPARTQEWAQEFWRDVKNHSLKGNDIIVLGGVGVRTFSL